MCFESDNTNKIWNSQANPKKTLVYKSLLYNDKNCIQPGFFFPQSRNLESFQELVEN